MLARPGEGVCIVESITIYRSSADGPIPMSNNLLHHMHHIRRKSLLYYPHLFVNRLHDSPLVLSFLTHGDKPFTL